MGSSIAQVPDQIPERLGLPIFALCVIELDVPSRPTLVIVVFRLFISQPPCCQVFYTKTIFHFNDKAKQWAGKTKQCEIDDGTPWRDCTAPE